MVQEPHVSDLTTLVGKPESLDEHEMPQGILLPPGTQVFQDKAFEIVEQLGEGGMGMVYKAYDPSMDRYIALKVLKPDVPESEKRKFHREAVIAANFSHPNLVRVLEVGARDELQWLAMEFLRGRDVGEVISNRKAISFRVVIDIFAQTLDALEYIHNRQIAHCDIKPENIFITRDAYNRRLVIVKLIDFGIARSLDGPLELQQYISGDPRYMPPEQAVINGKIDHRADLYALGMTLYEIMCRRHPYEDYIEEGPQALLEYHRTKVPVPPSAYLPENTPPPLARAFDAFFERACAKIPQARFLNAQDMKKNLMHLLNYLDGPGAGGSGTNNPSPGASGTHSRSHII